MYVFSIVIDGAYMYIELKTISILLEKQITQKLSHMMNLNRSGTAKAKSGFLQSDTTVLNGSVDYMICGLHVYDVKSTHYVFSLGSNGDTQFEDAIHARLPKMRIITTDPTLHDLAKKKLQSKKHINFIDTAIGNASTSIINNKAYESITFEQLRKKYKPYSIVKIDIEYSEHVIFNEHTDCNLLKNIDQILVEIHGVQVQSIFNLFSKCNMLLYSKEPNIWGCMGTICGEYSFISAEFAYKEYIAS